MKDTLEETLVAALESVDGLSRRVFPLVDIRYSTAPLAVYAQVRGSAQRLLDGPSELLTAEYTIYVLHSTYLKMRELAELVTQTCESLQGYKQDGLWIEQAAVELSSPDIEEYQVNLFRRTLTVTLEYQLYDEGE